MRRRALELTSGPEGLDCQTEAIFNPQDPVVTRIKRDQKIPLIGFVANTGGLLGLCMGFSLVSAFEIVYHCVLGVFGRMRHFARRFRAPQHSSGGPKAPQPIVVTRQEDEDARRSRCCGSCGPFQWFDFRRLKKKRRRRRSEHSADENHRSSTNRPEVDVTPLSEDTVTAEVCLNPWRRAEWSRVDRVALEEDERGNDDENGRYSPLCSRV